MHGSIDHFSFGEMKTIIRLYKKISMLFCSAYQTIQNIIAIIQYLVIFNGLNRFVNFWCGDKRLSAPIRKKGRSKGSRVVIVVS